MSLHQGHTGSRVRDVRVPCRGGSGGGGHTSSVYVPEVLGRLAVRVSVGGETVQVPRYWHGGGETVQVPRYWHGRRASLLSPSSLEDPDEATIITPAGCLVASVEDPAVLEESPAVWPGRYCSPRHRHALWTSSLDVNGIL